MPWTRRQVRYLESSGSALSSVQKAKMNAELHADPSMGHHKKGSAAMKQSEPKMREMRIEIHHGKGGAVTGHTVHHHMEPKSSGKSGAFMEETHHSFPFGPKDHAAMMEHIAQHIQGPMKAEAHEVAESEAEEGE